MRFKISILFVLITMLLFGFAQAQKKEPEMMAMGGAVPDGDICRRLLLVCVIGF